MSKCIAGPKLQQPAIVLGGVQPLCGVLTQHKAPCARSEAKLKQQRFASDALKSMTISTGREPPHQTLGSGCAQLFL